MGASGAGTSCAHSTITSTRIEYFAPYRIASDAANALTATQTADPGGCRPAGSVAHTGTTIPKDRLVIYQANTIDKNTATGADRYTIVIEPASRRDGTVIARAPRLIRIPRTSVAVCGARDRPMRESVHDHYIFSRYF